MKKIFLAVLFFASTLGTAYGQANQCWVWNAATSTWAYNTSCSLTPIAPLQIPAGDQLKVDSNYELKGISGQILDTTKLPQGDLQLGSAALQPAGAFQPAGTISGLAATSSTSLTVGTDTQTLTVATGLGFTANMLVTISDNGNGLRWMYGTVTSYSGTTLVVNVTASNGSGSGTNWTVAASGAPGGTGQQGSVAWGAIVSKGASYNLLSTDVNNTFVFNCVSGCTASLPASITSSGTWFKVKNIGVGTVVLSGTINGGTTNSLAQYDEVMVFSDGSNWYGNLTARSLNMTGEVTQTSSTYQATINLGSVTAGDRILISCWVAGFGTSPGTYFMTPLFSGSATYTFFGSPSDGFSAQQYTSVGTVYVALTGVIIVTGSGTMTIVNTGPENIGFDFNYGQTGIYAFFLRKQ